MTGPWFLHESPAHPIGLDGALLSHIRHVVAEAMTETLLMYQRHMFAIFHVPSDLCMRHMYATPFHRGAQRWPEKTLYIVMY